MFGQKLRQKISKLEQEQARHCQTIEELRRELTQVREDRDRLLDHLNLALIDKPAKFAERKLVERTSSEYVEIETAKKALQDAQMAFLKQQQQCYPQPVSFVSRYHSSYPGPGGLYYP